MPEWPPERHFEMRASCSAEIEGLFSLDAAHLVPLLCRADFRTRWSETVATGYCMKCKAQREIKNAKQITMKNGRPATEGACPVCGTKIFKIGAGTK
jgi:DNA-directed RNA polymerase subunit RPC12/RpoP